jgi:hypothetical protein
VAKRAESDEHYVLDRCDEILDSRGERQHRFPWLLGDASPNTGQRVRLPVDGYWPERNLVVEFQERQHTEAVRHFDKPDVMTVSGVHRGEQRRLYDQRKAELIPEHDIRLVIIDKAEFVVRSNRIVRDRERDLDVVRRFLA